MTHKHHSTYSNNHSDASQEVVARAAELSAQPTVAAAAAQAGRQLQDVAGRTEKLAKEYPWVTAGAMLGVGAILGALAHRFFGHRSTISELLGINALPSKAKRAVSKYF
jgi:ElaB/YqjD/DUF883 family membrane-anchored ribosome-binding protein